MTRDDELKQKYIEALLDIYEMAHNPNVERYIMDFFGEETLQRLLDEREDRGNDDND